MEELKEIFSSYTIYTASGEYVPLLSTSIGRELYRQVTEFLQNKGTILIQELQKSK